MRKSGCGKIYFVKKIDVNNLFGDLEKREQVSHFKFTTSREAKIQFCFETQVDFYCPSSVNILDELLQYFKRSSREGNDSVTPDDKKNIFGEREKMDRLIVLDNVSGFADKSNNL